MRIGENDLASTTPSRTRYRVVAFVVSLGMITYLDRACIATVAPHMMRDLNLSKGQMSLVFSVFSLAYAFFEIPTAWWADRKGTRHVLTRIVLWWSACTVFTGAVFSYFQLLIVRVLFGAGEAGAWPSVARTFSRWIPLRERGRVQGIFFAGAHLAGGLTPVVVIGLAGLVSWRYMFAIFGMTGVIWSLAWHRWFRNEPEEHRGVNTMELKEITLGRTLPKGSQQHGWAYWRAALTHKNMLPLCLAYIPNSCAFYFCITWLPTFLSEKHGFSALSLGVASGLPLVVSLFGDLFGGWTTDALVHRFGLRIGRAGVAAGGNCIAGLAMMGAAWVDHPYAAVALIATSVAATMATLGATWSTCLDIGGSHIGVISAMMNTFGQIGSIGGPIAVTALLTKFGDWNAPILGIGALFLVGALCWAFIDPNDRVFE